MKRVQWTKDGKIIITEHMLEDERAEYLAEEFTIFTGVEHTLVEVKDDGGVR